MVPSPRNYLRVRGEYSRRMLGGMGGAELPPRARRIRDARPHQVPPGGTTSACAENTERFDCEARGLGNYLRVRGEYRGLECLEKTPMELPPRARRIHGYPSI